MAKKLQVFGNRGKSAYQYALEGGYTGSEAEFKEKMARELEVAYDYDDLNNKILATAIKQEASGTVISVSDAAAVPLLGLDYEGENVTFSLGGNNLFDISKFKSSSYEVNNGDGSITLVVYAPDVTNNKITECFPTLKVGNTIMFSHTVYFGGDQRGTTKPLTVTQEMLDNNKFAFYGQNGNSTYTISDIMVNLGDTKLPYEPYVAPKTITVPSPDKLNLNDFVMNKPNTVITNDQNVPMEVTYVADPQIYIDNLATSLTNAVVSLGGEV